MGGSIERGLAEVMGDASGLTRTDLCDRLETIGRLRSSLDAAEARTVAAIDALHDRGADGVTVLRSTTKCSTRAAKAGARRAEVLQQMPRVAERFAAGRLGRETVDALVRAAELTSPGTVDGDETLLRKVESRPADLAQQATRDWVSKRERNADREKRLASQVKARSASCFRGDRGMTVLHAQFDPIVGTRIRKRLDREADLLWRHDGGRDGRPDDVRSPTQRRADAVARLFGIVREGDPVVELGGGGADTLLVVADVGVLDGTDPDGRCEIVDVGPVPTSILAALSPDTIVRGAIFAGEGRPLWLGRGRRLASLDQRLMLAVRDGGCRYCDAPTWHCHAHHIHDFNGPRRGRTDIDQLEFVCPADHTRLHRDPRTMPRTGQHHECDDDEAA